MDLMEDRSGEAVQIFIPNPARSQVPFALSAASKVIRFRGTLVGGEIDFIGVKILTITPSSSDLTRHFNGDTTKTRTVFAATDNLIAIHPAVQTITITGTDTSIEVEGM